MGTDLTLKRKVSIKKIFLTSLFGELSLITIFSKIFIFKTFIFKILIIVIVNILTFKYKNIKYTMFNVFYTLMYSLLIGSFTYFLTVQFRIDLVYSFKYIIILFLSPLIIIVYYTLTRRINTVYSKYYDIEIKYGKYTYKGVGFLDSGNFLSAYGKDVILVEKKYINYQKLKLLPVHFNALNKEGIVFCFKPNSLFVNGKIITNVLVGLSEKSFNIDGVSILLNSNMEGL